MIPKPLAVVRAEHGTVPVRPGDEHARIDPSLPREGYVLDCTSDRVELAGGSEAGLFYGRQTLRRLLPVDAVEGEVERVRIEDAPRFGWRGVLLDVARHFMPVHDVLRFVDLLAFHKLNVLHLHLTDDQGWRIEVPGWPRLTEVGSWRAESMLGSRIHGRYDGRPHGGFYTTADLRRIVSYAADRHITVVPEVDMPGHMQAAIAAYPELGNGFAGPVRTGWGISEHVLNLTPATLDFCRQVLDHVCDVFGSELIGIGGDECPTVEWPGGRELQAAFTAEMAAHLATRGRRVYGWDEILAGGAPPGAVIAAWRGTEPALIAARVGHQVVACPDVRLYLDYRQSDHPDEPTPVGTLLTLRDVHDYEPPADPLVLGAQANIWTEHMESLRRVEYMAFPRLCAFAEVMWGPAERDFADFSARLSDHLARLDALGVNYRPLSGPRPWDARPDAPGHPRTLDDRLAELREMTADLR
ncbi:beta-N-acetylhexosaminidase [Actinoplanes utahensis]|uniref:beta-N-acetylhexosaminidase n=1 Tax=Actinoplanes utahensis TaxID=1869 RepID=UPI001950C690|nr:beta-N-acetylhexosaminidase [Actinoplanes utahensis]GIF28550.1 beta-N-acetylhexosaminidase [Actinoplanes utahensis]